MRQMRFLFLCSYEHRGINEPAILLGGSFMVDVVEAAEEHGKEEVMNERINSHSISSS